MKFKTTYNDIREIAVIRTDRIGDIILTLPMCQGIKEILPNANLTIIAKKYVEPVLYNCKLVDRIIFIEDYKKDYKKIYNEFNPQVAFFPRPRFNEVYYAYKTNVPVRVGTAYRWYSFLFSHKIKDHRKISKFHEAKYNLRMVEYFFQRKLELKYVKIQVKPETKKRIDTIIDTLNIKKEKLIILHPGSGGSSITWPAYRFGELADLLIRSGFDVAITGSENEKPLEQIIRDYAPNVKDLTGMFNLYELIGFISISKGVVANSTGVLHISSVLEIPSVGLYPNTPHLSAKRWGPIGPFSSTLSPITAEPENIDNMELILPQDVFKELMNLISRANF